MKKFSNFIFKRILKWEIVVLTPKDSLKESSVVAVFPHTSYWDGIIGYFAMKSLGVNFRVISAAWLFFWPFKYIMKYFLNAFPVDGKNTIRKSVEVLKSQEVTNLIICPEGQLKATSNWSKGFYMISKKANVPIDLALFDYYSKIIFIKRVDQGAFDSSESLLKYISGLCEWYASPKYPSKFKLYKHGH